MSDAALDRLILALGVGFLAAGAVAWGWLRFMLFRNRWTYRRRLAVLEADPERYERLDSYEEMMRRWWVWDLRRFEHPPDAANQP